MIHPDTELRFVSDEIGYGVFATAPIPKGTIVYVKDELEIEISRYKFRKLDPDYRNIVEKFSYIDERGMRIISWDHAKYVNHKCECNSMSTGYGFEIAIRDIESDEEITDEYGLFNIPYAVDINCGCNDCRKTLLPTDIDQFARTWDRKVENALQYVDAVNQPLWDIMDKVTSSEIKLYLAGQGEYRSVSTLKFMPQNNVRKLQI